MDPNKRLHNWEHHGGKLVRMKTLNKKRQRRFRKKNKKTHPLRFLPPDSLRAN
jgi:hypothetical protein